ncbi:ectoine utilization protein EutA [uncultured Tateyamaria sp.]|uniref:aspartate racemase/maleate isomerase family protein n=1 Tax=uncultured Tateyamaria sp. TaxID=455651 RepID=UPI0026270038|nr:ectoine utilization protein EutA [uncultured Tateyamaria sp.]
MVSLVEHTAELASTEGMTRFGLVALSTDLTTERDFTRMLPEAGSTLHVTRVAFENPTTPENLRKMGPRIASAAELLVPGEAFGAICYGCTSASVELGDAAITSAVQAAHPNTAVVTPTHAALMAFSALGVRKVALLTPYLVETTEPMITYFEENGLDVVNAACFGLEDDRDMARVKHDSIVRAARSVDCPEAEAIFLSCTALPAVGTIAEIEAELKKPVVTSNQASAWAMCRLAGLQDYNPQGYGSLFERQI